MTRRGGGNRGLARCAAVLAALAALVGLALVPAGPALAATTGKSDKRLVAPDTKTPPAGTRVDVDADQLVYDRNSRTAVATGRVVITYGQYILVASRVEYDLANDRLRADGEIQMREPNGNILEANVVELHNRFRDGFAEHLRLLLTNDATITAAYARRSEGYLTVFERVTYTRCQTCVSAHGTPAWQLVSREVTHDENERTIYHRNTTLELLGVPVFYWPYLWHGDPTVTRRSGFLTPRFSYSNKYGFGVELPYFINLAPNYDLTLYPRMTTEQGPLMHGLWRHRLDSGKYDIAAAGIYQLDPGDVSPPGDRHFRGFVRTRGDFDLSRVWSWGWDATLFSDDTFMRDYGLDRRIEVANVVHLTGIDDRNYFTLRAYHFQGLLGTDDSSTFPVVAPYLRHDYVFGDPVLGGELSVSTDIYSLTRDRPWTPYWSPAYDVRQGTEQLRATSRVDWQRQMISDGGLIVTPFASVRGDLLRSRNVPDGIGGFYGEHTDARVLPSGGVDVRYPLIRSDEIGQHVLTPVAQIIAAADETGIERFGNEDAITLNFTAQSLFLHDRFTGNDRYEGGTRANVGLLYSILMPDGGFVRASFGQSYHLAGRNSFDPGSGLDTTDSDFVTSLAWQMNDMLTLSYQARFDNDAFDVRTQEASAQLQTSRLNAAVNYVNLVAEPAYGRPADIEQIWGSGELALWNGWSLFGGLRYDIASDTVVRNYAGIGYECDCMSVRLYYKEEFLNDRDTKKDRSVMLSVELKTLGSARVGTGL